MSAFLCNDYHISYIVQAGINYKAWANLGKGYNYLTTDNAQHVFETLKRENLRSVNYRYQENESARFLGLRSFVDRVEPLQVIKAIHCLAYQSNEHPQWETSLAKHICNAIEGSATREIPGYECASWELQGRGVAL